MGSAGQNRQAKLCGGCRRALPQAQEFSPRVVEARLRLGRDFDLRLQEFAPDAACGAAVGSLKKRVRCLSRRLEGLAIAEKIFFLDAELKQLVGRKDPRLAIRWNKRADAQSPLA